MRHSLIAIAFVGLCLCFTACVHDVDEKVTEVRPGSVYLQLSLSDSKPSTRTYGGTIEDELSERKISDLSIFLIKEGSGSSGSSSEFLRISDVRINQDNESDLIEIPAEKQGTYKLYVVTNIGTSHPFSPSTSSETAFIGKYGSYLYNDAKKFWTPNQFFMTNLQNEVNGLAAVEVDLSGYHPMEDPIRVEVNLERMSLKVVVTEASVVDAKPVGTVVYGTDKNYKLISMTVDGVCLMNCATDINLIQQWDNATKAADYQSASPKGYPELLLVSPSSDPEYSITNGYYNRWQDLVDPSTLLINSTTEFVSPGVPMYCFENNSPYYSALPAAERSQSTVADFAAEKTKMKGRVTAVAIRVRCELADGGYITEDLTVDPEEGNWTRADVNGQTFYQYKGICYSDVDKIIAQNPDLTGISSSSTVSELRAKGVKVFENGCMYYIHWIKDQNYTDDGAHYYTVMRNTYYGLEVEEINGLGEDIPGGEEYNPYDPIDVEEYSLKITPVVRDWTLFNIDVTL